jgi:hypothetical protein
MLPIGRVSRKSNDGWHIAGSPDNLQLGDGFIYVVEEKDAGGKRIVKYAVKLPRS